MKRALIAFVVLLAGACTKQESSAETGSSTTRPAAITDELADTSEAYVRVFESMARDIAASHGDCRAATVVVERHAAEAAALDIRRGERLKDQMNIADRDPATRAWMKATFERRLANAGDVMKPAEHCKDNAEFIVAYRDAMTQFPMIRKKQ